MRLALLRGINVGGHRKLPMAELRDVCAGLGWTDVRTYIQSGNLVFRAEGSEADVARALRQGIAARFGYDDVPVIVRTADEVSAALAAVPFETEGVDPKHLHIVFLDRAPDPAAVAALDPDRSPGDRFVVIGREIHLSLPNGGGRSKLGLDWFEGKLGVRGSGRNLRTVQTLLGWMSG